MQDWASDLESVDVSSAADEEDEDAVKDRINDLIEEIISTDPGV